jgi:hypothetical protein
LPLRQRRDRGLFYRTLAHPTYGRERSRVRTGTFVRATGGHAAVSEDSTERTEAGDAYSLRNAAALAAAFQQNASAAAAPRERRVFCASEDADSNALALLRIRPHNAAVEPPPDHVSSAQQAHNEMTRLLRARVDVSRESSVEKVDTRWLDAAALELHWGTVSESRV